MTKSALLVSRSTSARLPQLRAVVASALAEAGWPEPVWCETASESDGSTQARRAVLDGAEVLLVCGGDGTVRSVLPALAGTEVALAVLATGTGNLLARNLGLPEDIRSAALLATGTSRRRIDVGDADGRLFLIAAGIGLDAQVMAETTHASKRRLGWVAYVVTAIRHLGGPGFRATIRLDSGPPLEREVRSVLVVNQGQLPAGLSLVRSARPDDGVLEVVLISARRPHQWLGVLGALVGGARGGTSWEALAAREVVVSTTEPKPREIDGDPLEPGKTLSVQVWPGALTVCVPAGPDTIRPRARPGQ